MKCLSCNKRKAQVVSPYGALPCKTCQNRQKNFKSNEAIEITTSEIREERKEYAADIEQRYEGGTPNLNYINKYGTKGFTPSEIKAARARHGTYYRDSSARFKE